jgi:hypothetical protein
MGRRRGGTHGTRVRIFEDKDHLALKFYKLVAHEQKKGEEHLRTWFYSREHEIDHHGSMPRKVFGELIGHFDFHEIHPKTKSIICGKQLIAEQVSRLQVQQLT